MPRGAHAPGEPSCVHARRTPAREPDRVLLHTRLKANQRSHMASALIAIRPSEQVVIMTCHHSLQSVAVILKRQSSEHDCCCQFNVTEEFNVTESHGTGRVTLNRQSQSMTALYALVHLIIGPSSESRCLCTYQAIMGTHAHGASGQSMKLICRHNKAGCIFHTMTWLQLERKCRT